MCRCHEHAKPLPPEPEPKLGIGPIETLMLQRIHEKNRVFDSLYAESHSIHALISLAAVLDASLPAAAFC
jgi:hypothetical protein